MKNEMTAREFMDQLARDAEYQSKSLERDSELKARSAEWRKAQEPLLKELARAGFQVDDVWDLVARLAPYPGAVPILVTHLTSRNYPPRVLEGIARALAVPDARRYFTDILEVYKRSSARDVKDGTSAALCAIADGNKVEELIQLVEGPSYGQNRAMFLDAILHHGGARGEGLVQDLSSDPDLGEEAKRVLGSKNCRRSSSRKS